MNVSTYLLDRADLNVGRIATTPAAALEPGQARLKVSRFALTANNVTYAVFGEMMRYWDFFPAGEGQGIAPVWGYADVVESAHDAIAVGERVFGYLPFASHCVVEPSQVSAASFTDASAHRQGLSPFYNSYTRTAGEPGYDRAQEDLVCLLRPLFMTGFLLDDWLAQNSLFGAQSVIASSASSKTALAMAYGLKQRGVGVIGLTSPGNRAFVERSGFYSRVIAYPDIASESPDQDAVYVDFAGDSAVTHAVHARWGSKLKFSSMVGGAHWDATRIGPPAVGPQPELFFAPDVMGARMKDWGAAEFYRRYGAAWAGFGAKLPGLIAIRRLSGLSAGVEAWSSLLSGSATPDQGLIVEP
jgi:hypothetical protein